MKTTFIKILSLFLALAIILCAFASCEKKNTKLAMQYKNSDGKVTGEIDQKLMSLIVAVVNFQLGTDALEDNMWDMAYQEGNDTTVKQIVMAQSTAYAKGLLQAEYLCDKVYNIGLSDKQQDSIDTYISDASALFGSKKEFENTLSVYGADIAALERYISLVLKQDTLFESLYAENGLRRNEIEQRKPQYFSEHYVICDHILLKYSAGIKDDGTTIPISEEEKSQKREKAKTLYNEITNGVRDFDEALGEFNEDTYKLGYPFGYFVPDSFYWSGISQKVQDAALEMQVSEIRFVDTEDGAYIIRKNEMNPALYASNGDFETYIDANLSQEDFLSVCDSADGIIVNNDVINELNPSTIPSFNIDTIGQ